MYFISKSAHFFNTDRKLSYYFLLMCHFLVVYPEKNPDFLLDFWYFSSKIRTFSFISDVCYKKTM